MSSASVNIPCSKFLAGRCDECPVDGTHTVSLKNGKSIVVGHYDPATSDTPPRECKWGDECAKRDHAYHTSNNRSGGTILVKHSDKIRAKRTTATASACPDVSRPVFPEGYVQKPTIMCMAFKKFECDLEGVHTLDCGMQVSHWHPYNPRHRADCKYCAKVPVCPYKDCTNKHPSHMVTFAGGIRAAVIHLFKEVVDSPPLVLVAPPPAAVAPPSIPAEWGKLVADVAWGDQ